MFKQSVVLILCCLFAPLTVAANEAYVSESLSIWLHSGPGSNYRILGSLNAGDPLKINGAAKEKYTPVIDAKGREGWVESKHLSNTAGYRQQAEILQQQLTEAKTALATTNSQLTSQNAQLKSDEQTLADLRQQIAQLQESNNELTAAREAEDLEKQLFWFKYGAIVLGCGVALGLVLTLIPWRRQPKRWM